MKIFGLIYFDNWVCSMLHVYVLHAVQDGVRREVLEETGLVMEPTTLLMVECASGAWFRFVITGTVTGTFRHRV
jgi:8-oxo-dGDP phosphatase